MNTRSAYQPDLWRQRGQWLRTRGRAMLPFVTGVLATLAALLLYRVLFPGPDLLTLTEVEEAVVQTLAEATPAPSNSSLVYEVIRPSLVYIRVQTPAGEDEEEPGSGLGSGVVVNTDGQVLTSLHVVTNATAITLTFADGTQTGGAIIATLPESDIAVVQPSPLPPMIIPATLGNPGAMRIGDEAYAVGHPFGLYGSMSTGVISGLERTFRPPNSGQRLEGLMQIDAAVNPGNSGGPLLNRAGQVVGIVTGLANPTEDNFFVGIGFAVPINVAAGGAGLPPY